jgi:hypothetical protein
MSVGISLLCNPKYCISCNGYANDLLVLFVQQSQHLYGREFVVYNVHGLIHLAADVANHGSLDAFSAFPYENYLKSVKRLVRKPETPLPQIIRRLSEQRRCKVNRADNQQAMSLSEEHYSGPVPDSHNPCQQFRKLKTDKFFLSQNGAADNCAVVHGLGPVLIRNILKSSDDDVHVVCQQFAAVTDLFDYPLPSRSIDIYKASDMCAVPVVVAISDITCKCVCLPCQGQFNTFAILPLIHQEH